MINSRLPRVGGGLISVAFAALLVGCTVGPDFKRPDSDLPKDFGVAQSQAPAPERWWVVFQDPVLDKLVDEALAANHDLRAAAERIEQARARLGIARSDYWPDAGVEYGASRSRSSERSSFPLPPDAIESSTHRLVLRASWELDFWGKFRRATEAARAEMLASEAGRDAVRNSLVGDVTRGYFAMRALDRRLESLERTRMGREKSLELQKVRLDAGVVSELEYRQVESDLRVAEALMPVVRQARLAQDSALAVLLGRSPREVYEGNVERGNPATPVVFEVPAGVPSDVLLRRPDLREAEARLHAANARIGVARAAYFPSISLTGFFGGESTQLSDLFSGPARVWSIGGNLLQPLFASSAIRGGVDLANAQTREAAELYHKAIANAFREVRLAIAAQTNLRAAHLSQLERERALTRTAELTRLRYDNGAVSLFEYLEAERQLMVARLEVIDAERDRRNAIVDLYLALGA
ncbi:MAG TPA: efflux transporter outer membrane subunit [Usitatibacter sp.]|nr:efflux transporter outer membrane subunit [Usitatibacter sp.]